MLPPKTSYLDVREERDGRFPGPCASIPLSQLRDRLAELPSKAETIQILETGPEAASALDFFKVGGRKAALAPVATWTDEERVGRLWAPNSFLESVACELTPGQALDLGCGSGRNAVFLASLGWQVAGVDRLPDAIAKGRELASRYGVQDRISWHCIDGVRPELFSSTDLICLFFFFDPRVLRTVAELASINCRLLIETFSETHARRFGQPSTERLVSIPKLGLLLPNFTISSYDEGWRSSGAHTGRLVAQRSTS